LRKPEPLSRNDISSTVTCSGDVGLLPVRSPLREQRAFASKTKENVMDWNRVEGNWKQVKGKVKEQWGKLTDDDLDRIAGKRDQLEGKIQERYGIEKDRVSRDIDDWYGRQGW
jgi:uncharacterized protein YjbJ (UPF0337 family)